MVAERSRSRITYGWSFDSNIEVDAWFLNAGLKPTTHTDRDGFRTIMTW